MIKNWKLVAGAIMTAAKAGIIIANRDRYCVIHSQTYGKVGHCTIDMKIRYVRKHAPVQ